MLVILEFGGRGNRIRSFKFIFGYIEILRIVWFMRFLFEKN